MPKLTTDQLHFIDTYLKNSGVEYVDIRYEMTDHIACALEEQKGDFSERFRVYMIQNKLSLLSGNSRFKRLALRRAGSELLKTLCQPWVFPVLMVLVFVNHYLFSGTNLSDAASYMRLIFVAAYFVGLAKVSDKSKFSVSSKLYGVCGFILYYANIIIIPERFIKNLWIVFTVYSIVITMGCALSVTALRVHKKYKLNYAT